MRLNLKLKKQENVCNTYLYQNNMCQKLTKLQKKKKNSESSVKKKHKFAIFTLWSTQVKRAQEKCYNL